MHLRIGGDQESSLIGALRESQATRARSPVSDGGGGTLGRREGDDTGVVIRLSPEARKQLAKQREPEAEAPPQDAAVVGQPDPAEDAAPTEPKGAPEATKNADDKKVSGKKELTSDQKDVVQKLQSRDTQVRAHEAAHMAAARGLGGGASYSYQTGPDGRRYAVGGEVPVQISSGRTADETIQNAQTVRAAALAPADPSSQDLAVAAQATQMEAEARQQKSAELREKGTSGVDGKPATTEGGDTKAAKVDGKPAIIAGGTGKLGQPAQPDDDQRAIKAPSNDNAPDGLQSPAASDPGHDSLMIFSTIKAERPTSSASLGHMHSDSNCGFCRGAAAKYA